MFYTRFLYYHYIHIIQTKLQKENIEFLVLTIKITFSFLFSINLNFYSCTYNQNDYVLMIEYDSSFLNIHYYPEVLIYFLFKSASKLLNAECLKCIYYQQRSYSIKANVRPSVRMSTTFRGKRDFLGPLLRYRSNFCADSPHK